MKMVERVFGKKTRKITSVNKMQLAFMSERGTIDAAFILGRLQEKYHAKV